MIRIIPIYTDMETVLFYGAFCDKNHKLMTGQTVVSSIIIEQLERSFIVKKVNIADKTLARRGSIFFAIARSFQYLTLFFKLFFLLVINKIDIVYYQLVFSKLGIIRDYIALRIISLFNVPIIGHALGIADVQQIVKEGGRISNYCQWNYSIMTRIIVEGDKMKECFNFFHDYNKKVTIVPNGLNEEYPFKKKPKSIDRNGHFRLLYLSNLIYSKGYFDVLKAMDILVNSDNKNVECIFAGRFYHTFEEEDNNSKLGGRDAFDSFVTSHGLTRSITYVEGLYGEEKKDAFLRADAFVLPSYYSAEGQPMAILEAMSYGCVPIVTAHGHIPSMVNNTNGCVVNPKDPNSIADSVTHLMESPEVYCKKSAQAISDFNNKFTGEVFSSAIVNIIKQCISN